MEHITEQVKGRRVEKVEECLGEVTIFFFDKSSLIIKKVHGQDDEDEYTNLEAEFKVGKLASKEFNINDAINDCFVDVIGVKPKKSQINKIIKMLPADIKILAEQWGENDTEFRDKVCLWLKKNLQTFCDHAYTHKPKYDGMKCWKCGDEIPCF